MTLYESLLKKDGQDGQVVIPYGAKIGDEYVSGYVDPEWLEQAFADFVDKKVPLSESDYQALLNASTEMWKLNWQKFREQGVI